MQRFWFNPYKIFTKMVLKCSPKYITSLSYLNNLVNNQFSCNRTFEKLTSHLYRVTQGNEKSLRFYVGRFEKEALDIPHLDVETTIKVFNIVMKKDSPSHEDFFMTSCNKLDEVRSRALRFTRLKEDKKIVSG